MYFNGTKPIYLQIADIICDKIIKGEWQQGERIPSVREMGSNLEVNPNTVMRSYDWLSENNIIFNKRGIGFFVGNNALELVRSQRKEQLLCNDLQDIVRRMQQLNISKDEVIEKISIYLQETKQSQ